MKRYIFAAAIALLSVFVVACGGAEEAAVPDPVTINVTGTDSFVFDPAQITVETGQEITLNFENEGALEHSWVLVPTRVEATEATDEDAVRGISTGLVAGGDSNSINFVAPAAGTYQIVCTVAGHAAGGMVGELIVTE